MNNLPMELKINIFVYLPFHDLVKLLMVTKEFQCIVTNIMNLKEHLKLSEIVKNSESLKNNHKFVQILRHLKTLLKLRKITLSNCSLYDYHITLLFNYEIIVLKHTHIWFDLALLRNSEIHLKSCYLWAQIDISFIGPTTKTFYLDRFND